MGDSQCFRSVARLPENAMRRQVNIERENTIRGTRRELRRRRVNGRMKGGQLNGRGIKRKGGREGESSQCFLSVALFPLKAVNRNQEERGK